MNHLLHYDSRVYGLLQIHCTINTVVKKVVCCTFYVTSLKLRAFYEGAKLFLNQIQRKCTLLRVSVMIWGCLAWRVTLDLSKETEVLDNHNDQIVTGDC